LFIYARVTFQPSRSSKVTDVVTNRKLVCDFLLVPNGNLAPFRRFCSFYVLLTPPLFQPNFGGVSVEVSERTSLKLFGSEIIFEEF